MCCATKPWSLGAKEPRSINKKSVSVFTVALTGLSSNDLDVYFEGDNSAVVGPHSGVFPGRLGKGSLSSQNRVKFRSVAPLMTDPPPTSFTIL